MSRRKRRAYLTLIALSALGVVVDRLVGPATSVGAELAVTGPRPRPAPAPSAGPAGQSLGATSGVVLTAARFPQTGSNAESPQRNIFGPSDSVRQAWKSGPADNDAGLEPDSGEIATARFADVHALSAVVGDRDFSMAVVDGRSIRIGEELDGCRLLRVTGQSAFFQCAGAVVELTLGEHPTPGVGLKSRATEVDEPRVAEDEE